LLGGDKTVKTVGYQEYVAQAENLYDEYLETLKREGYDNG
jgi:hypothetical protein